MSYLNQNQKSTFKKFLLSTAVVSSFIVCTSSGGLAMEDEWDAPISQRRAKLDQSIVSLVYYNGGGYLDGHNAVLFEWKEQGGQHAETFFATYRATEPVYSGVRKVVTDEAANIDVVEVFSSNMMGNLKIVGTACVNILVKDKTVPGSTEIKKQEEIENFKKTVGFEIKESWSISKEDAQKGIHKACEIASSPTRHSATIHTPLDMQWWGKVDNKKYNSLSFSEILLSSSGITEKRKLSEVSPYLWNPKGR